MSTSAAASAEIAKVAQTAVTTEELLSGDSNILDQLLLMFEKGLNQPIIYWQLASILGSLFLAWLLGKYIRMRIIKHLAANEIIESDEIPVRQQDLCTIGLGSVSRGQVQQHIAVEERVSAHWPVRGRT